ncbi:MAG: DUF4870 domain-containing protein [Sedimentisphaerales bacterium]|nr:DUF4870 domain-containing protein [Sedimentisphaerales bacterium]
MENNEQTPKPVEKFEGQTPAQEKVIEVQPEGQAPVAEQVSAEKPESQAPVAEKVSPEKLESEASVKQEVCNEKAGTANQSPGCKEANKDARMWAMICHLSGLAGIILPASGNIVAPLIVWQIKKDNNPFIDEQGKEAVNFQISMSIYLIASIILSFICIGVPLIIATIIVFFVFTLIAAVKANNGLHYRYPLTLRFIK